jgi:uncharacterized membrane protein
VGQVEETVDVDVPVRVAYDHWTRFETFPEFMNGVESVTRTEGGHDHWVTNVAGIVRTFDTEVTGQEQDRRVAWRTVGGEARHTGEVTFEPLDPGRTRVTVHIDWQPADLLERIGDAIGVDDHQVKADARRFKQFVERGGQEWLEQAGPALTDSGPAPSEPGPTLAETSPLGQEERL